MLDKCSTLCYNTDRKQGNKPQQQRRAKAMFDKELSFEQIKEDYFSHAYGENWRDIAEYLQKIGNMFDVNYLEYLEDDILQ